MTGEAGSLVPQPGEYKHPKAMKLVFPVAKRASANGLNREIGSSPTATLSRSARLSADLTCPRAIKPKTGNTSGSQGLLAVTL